MTEHKPWANLTQFLGRMATALLKHPDSARMLLRTSERLEELESTLTIGWLAHCKGATVGGANEMGPVPVEKVSEAALTFSPSQPSFAKRTTKFENL